jgi:formylglycine-generating enzyme required for sulfatase activity
MIKMKSVLFGILVMSLAFSMNFAQESKPKPKIITNSIGIELVYIPAGSFNMGSPKPANDPFSNNNEKGEPNELPQHKVTISNGFYLGKYEVTQEQWVAVMGDNPSNFKSEKVVGGNSRRHPVEQVSWDDAQTFIQKLNQREGGDRYRLPTEAEWEYACRAGTTTDYYGNVDSIAWYTDNSGRSTHQVGQKQPNSFGLYDMSGNVMEWCQDLYDENYYSQSPGSNPAGPDSGPYLIDRVLRGGSYGVKAKDVRSAFRSRSIPVSSFRNIGFRLASSSVGG